jgi:hypothetical protein
METAAAPDTQVLTVGKDRLTIRGEFVTIDAAAEIPDWQVREFQRMPIYLGEFKFFLRQKLPAEPGFRIRYLLERWPEDAHFDAGPISFIYDEQFVADRDAEMACNERYDKLGRILICLYPFLGFLWSGTKKRLVPAGFIPRSITGISIFTTVCLLVLQGTFIRMRLGLFTVLFGNMARFEGLLLTLDYALFGLMLVDIVLRFDQHLKGVENPWGFCEWITKPFRRRQLEEEEA